MAAPSFARALLSRCPPWLQRPVGAALMLGLGDPIDALAGTSTEAIKARFPDAGRLDALATIGTERRIVTGPSEPASTYAARLGLWLDSHRTRGGPYALLAQLFAFWRFALNVRIELVAQSGARWSMDTAGAVVRDVIAPFVGVGFWAQDWLFFHAPQIMGLTLTTDTGAAITDDAGNPITVGVDLSTLGGTLPTIDAETFKIVPRSWTAAHLKRCTIVLLYGTGFVYGYPVFRTFGDGGVYGANPPVFVTIDF